MKLQETRQYGNLARNVFACYWNAVSTPLALTVLLSVVFMQITRNLSDAWLAHWVTDTTLDNNKNDTNSTLDHMVQPVYKDSSNDTSEAHTTGYYLGIFASLALTNSLVTLVRSFLFAYAGLKAAKYIHDKLLNKIMYVSIEQLILTNVCVINDYFQFIFFRQNLASST